MRLSNRLGASARFWLGSLLAGISLMIVSSGAWALTTCTGSGGSMTVSMPATISVPRDATVGTPLTEWVSTPAKTNWWTCSSDVKERVGVGFDTFLPGSGLNFTDTAVTYNVFNTSLPGVGIAISIRTYTGACEWMDSAAWSTVLLGGLIATTTCNDTHKNASNGGQLRARLVKTGPITAGAINAAPIARELLYVNGAYDYSRPITFSTTPTRVMVLSCVTPDVQVPLGPHLVSELGGGKTFTSSTAFKIALNNCPTGMTSVSYQIDALTKILISSASVVALDSRSSAVGVGVQLLDGSGNVFPLGTPNVFGGYSNASGGNLTIPLQARYYRTGSTVTGGIANTAMTFTMTYQ